VANRRITDLPGITSVDIVDADLFTVVDVSEVDPGLKNKKFTVAEHKAYLNNYYLQLTGGTIANNLVVGGTLNVSGNATLQHDLNVSDTAFINNFVSTGLISGVTITGTSILGVNVNGNNGSFTSLQATNTALVNATATNFSGAAITGDSIRASGITGQVISGDNVYGVNISGTTISGQTGIFTSSLSGALISGVSGVFTSRLSGQTITGNVVQGTTGIFTTVSGSQFVAGGVTFVSGSGDVRPRGLFSFPTTVGTAGFVLATNADGTTSWTTQNSAGYSGGDFTIYSGNLIVSGSGYFESGVQITGVLSGTTITGTAAQFSVVTGISGVFTNLSGSTITGNSAQFSVVTGISGVFTNLSGSTITGNSAQFSVVTGISGVFTNLSGNTITGNTFNGGSADFNVLSANTLGTASIPVFTFTTDPDTGIYSPGANQLAVSTSGTARFSVASNGVTTIQNGAVAVIGTLTDGATITPDFAANCNFTVTISGSRTVANPTNITAGQTGSIFIIQGSGSNTLSWGSYWDFPGGTAPTLSTASGAIDRVDYVVRSSTSIHTVFTANYS